MFSTISFNSFNNGESIETSASGRKLNFCGKCVRFLTIKRSPIMDKVFAVSHRALEVLASAIPPAFISAVGGAAIYRSIALSRHIALTAAFVGFIGLVTLGTALYTGETIYSYLSHLRKMEEREQALIDAVNTTDKDAFKKLPRFTDQNLYDWANMGSFFYTDYTSVPLSYLKHPLAFGIDDGNRPTFCICAKGSDGKQSSLTLFSRYTNSLDPWVLTTSGTHTIMYGAESVSFLKQLVAGTHPDYKIDTPTI